MSATIAPSSAVYSAHAFHANFPDGRAAGYLTLDDTGFRFESESGAVAVPFEGAQLTLGGASDRLVFVQHPGLPEWSIYTSERSLLRDPRVLQHPGLLQAVGQIRSKRLRNLAITLGVLLVLLAVPALMLLNLGILTRFAARQVPVEWEQQIGKLAFDQYEIQNDLVEDAEASRLLEQLTSRLTAALPASKYTFHFYISNEPSLNAFALPGGYVVVHSGLLLRAQSAEELLGVLAHEISHVTEQHGTRNIIASAGAALTIQLLIGDASGVFGTLASAAPFLLTQKYSRGFEREADQHGYELLVRANVDPAGLASFFEKLKAEEARVRAKMRKHGDDTSELMEKLPEFLSTHPTTDSRIDALRRMVAAHTGAYHDFGDAFTVLKQRVQAATVADAASEESRDEDAN